jgi:hypothetical protein
MLEVKHVATSKQMLLETVGIGLMSLKTAPENVSYSRGKVEPILKEGQCCLLMGPSTLSWSKLCAL